MTELPGELTSMTGPAALPRDNGELIFAAPWEGRAVALAVAAWLAIEAGVPVLTRHGDRYAALEGGVATVPIED